MGQAAMPNLSRAVLLAAALGLAAAAPAQAFTFENADGSAANARTNLLDPDTRLAVPDKPASKFDESSGIKQGNFYLNFNNQRSFNERYNADNLFDPVARDGR
jgi:hypothetical protein